MGNDPLIGLIGGVEPALRHRSVSFFSGRASHVEASRTRSGVGQPNSVKTRGIQSKVDARTKHKLYSGDGWYSGGYSSILWLVYGRVTVVVKTNERLINTSNCAGMDSNECVGS
ncbi:hypothetical protein DIRU0_B11320 [Diutina rugosa]